MTTTPFDLEDHMHGKWSRMLKTHECTIETLLEMSKLPMTLLKEKLTQAEELLSELGDHFGEEFQQTWNIKIAKWWKRLAEVEDKDDKTECEQPTQQSVKTNEMLNFQLSKESVLSQIKREFALLEPATDRKSLGHLYDVISQARSLTFCFWNDGQLHSELFGLAFFKLPPAYQQEYLRQFNYWEDWRQQKKSLRELHHFLTEKLAIKTSTHDLNVKEMNRSIEEDFARLKPLVGADDADGIRGLLLIISKSIRRHYSDRFKLTVLMHTLRKLPESMKERFARMIENEDELPNKKALILLRHFLGNELRQKNGDFNLCLECVEFGHRAADCSKATCFNCYIVGHMSSHCPN